MCLVTKYTKDPYHRDGNLKKTKNNETLFPVQLCLCLRLYQEAALCLILFGCYIEWIFYGLLVTASYEEGEGKNVIRQYCKWKSIKIPKERKTTNKDSL